MKSAMLSLMPDSIDRDLVQALTKYSDFSPAVSQLSQVDSRLETFALPEDESIAQPPCPPPLVFTVLRPALIGTVTEVPQLDQTLCS